PPIPTSMDDGPSVASIAFESARGHAAAIIRDLRSINYKDDIVPVDQSSFQTLVKDSVFWSLLILGVVPLLIATLQKPSYQLTLFALFFALLWGFVFKGFVLRIAHQWPIAIASLLFTGVAGTAILLWAYKHVLPDSYLKLAHSTSELVSLFGFI